MNFFQKYKWLIPMQLFIGGLLIIRIICTRSILLAFIPWNLFLGVIPLYFSFKLIQAPNKFMGRLYMLLWLLFFPNACYIITDIFHLKEHYGIPLWFDLLILFSSAISGLIVGFLSMQNVEHYLRTKAPLKYISWIVLSFFMLCGYGIYLGRYLRWNSWDIIVQPFSLLWDIKQDIFHPLRNIECWVLTLLFGIWMHLLYGYFKRIKQPA